VVRLLHGLAALRGLGRGGRRLLALGLRVAGERRAVDGGGGRRGGGRGRRDGSRFHGSRGVRGGRRRLDGRCLRRRGGGSLVLLLVLVLRVRIDAQEGEKGEGHEQWSHSSLLWRAEHSDLV